MNNYEKNNIVFQLVSKTNFLPLKTPVKNMSLNEF